MSSFRRISFLVMVFVLIVVATGVTAAAQKAEPVQDSAPKLDDPYRDMKGYADEWGIDLDEAARRFELQDAAGELDANLSAKEQDTFAGLWIEHTPEFRIVVQFTRDGEKTIQSYVEGKSLANVVKVQTASVTRAELKAVQEETLRVTRDLGIAMNSGINVQENRVELYVLETTTLLNDALQEAKIQLSDNVEIIVVDDLATEEVINLYGGLPLGNDCTSGWPVLYYGYYKGVTTAAHCSNYETYAGQGLYMIQERYDTHYDIQWHYGYTSVFTVKPWFQSKAGYYRLVKWTRGRDDQSEGMYVCKQGRTTDYTCGYIIDKDYSWGLEDHTNHVPTWIRVHSYDGVNLSSGGDSGGPWFNGNTAYGTHKGGMGDDAVYMAINYLSGLNNVTIYTD